MADQLLSDARVLIVEDEMLVMMQIEDMLADLGCTQITRASNVVQALSAIGSQFFDLATLDLNLGGTRSNAVADALTEQHVPFAYSTGYGGMGLDEDHRPHPMLNKPFSSARFTEVMTQLLTPTASKPALSAL
ncbi:MAG: response regulator [Sphingomonas sp.]|nr:response regulator [Sphingomonas sp.]